MGRILHLAANPGVLFSLHLVLVDLYSYVRYLLFALHCFRVHLVQGFLHLYPVPIIFLLESLHVVLARLFDVGQDSPSLLLEYLVVLFGAVLTLSPNFIELSLQGVPQPLQSLGEDLVNSFSKTGHIPVCVLHVHVVDFVHLLDGALQVVIVAVELVVEGADYLLLLLQFLIDGP